MHIMTHAAWCEHPIQLYRPCSILVRQRGLCRQTTPRMLAPFLGIDKRPESMESCCRGVLYAHRSSDLLPAIGPHSICTCFRGGQALQGCHGIVPGIFATNLLAPGGRVATDFSYLRDIFVKQMCQRHVMSETVKKSNCSPCEASSGRR